MRERAFLQLIEEIAERDDGVVTRGELLARNAGDSQIQRGKRRGLLTAAAPGVYVHGRSTLSQRALMRVGIGYGGLLSCGVSHRCAAEHQEALQPRPGHAAVITTRTNLAPTLKTSVPMHDGRPGLVRVRRTRGLDVSDVEGIPCTPMPRTLIDIAGSDGQVWLERTWRGAAYKKLLVPSAIAAEVAGPGRRKGTPLVRALLASYPVDEITAADHLCLAELDFHHWLLGSGVSAPEVNAWLLVNGHQYRPDFLWRLLKLIVELDDPSHDHPVARARDALRDRELSTAGFTVLRFPTERARLEPAACVAELTTEIARRRSEVRDAITR